MIEKATELGASAIVPLECERSVLRLNGERAQKRQVHWHGVAVAAAEQSGRTRLPEVQAVTTLPTWLQGPASPRWHGGALAARQATHRRWHLGCPGWAARRWCFPERPEGGLTSAERALALAAGFVPVSLGPRVRADTAPLAALACIGALAA